MLIKKWPRVFKVRFYAENAVLNGFIREVVKPNFVQLKLLLFCWKQRHDFQLQQRYIRHPSRIIEDGLETRENGKGERMELKESRLWNFKNSFEKLLPSSSYLYILFQQSCTPQLSITLQSASSLYGSWQSTWDYILETIS